MALLIATPAAGAAGGETIDVAIPPTAQISCVTNGHKPLGKDPTLTAGNHATCTVSGLNPKEGVTVKIDAKGKDVGPAMTNAKGGLTFPFTVPPGLTIGAHRLIVTGQKSKATAVQEFKFTNPPGRQTKANSNHHKRNQGPGQLAFTGEYVIIPIAAATALLLTGAALTTATRRRRSPQ
jgi:hypothetical protein